MSFFALCISPILKKLLWYDLEINTLHSNVMNSIEYYEMVG